MKQPMLGVMVDCSRNAVPNMTSAKYFIDCLEKMGYNTLMYYTEDTYEVKDEPYFGYLRGRFTADELRELDAYAAAHGIELIPCIQTLAHLNAIFRWDVYREINDTADILLVENERTMQLIENMFRSLRECFRSDKIHIGMDEAHMLGLGKFLDRHGYQNRTEILLNHLNKVCKMADRYGFKPMMWGDMFFRLAAHGQYYVKIDDEAAAKIRPLIPENLTLVYWDYYSKNEDTYRLMVDGNKKLCDRVIFGGGVWTWSGFVPSNRTTYAATKPAVTVCREKGISDLFFTMWGDDGAECSLFAALPALLYAAELSRGNDDLESIKKKFFDLFGESYDDVLSMGELDILLKKTADGQDCASKILLYNDVLMGIYDPLVPEDAAEKFASLAEHFEKCAAGTKYFAPHFECYAALARVLEKKATVGIALRAAYKAGDRDTLRALSETLLEIAKRMREFLRLYRILWMSEKRPHGFDVQEIRIGGAVTRVESAAERINDYLDGKLDRIDELEETLLVDNSAWNSWGRAATPNVL